MAMSEFLGELYLGSFDGGLCSTSDGLRFRTHEGPFRMINDLEVVGGRLYIAASTGLFFTSDGQSFVRDERVNLGGVNGLAFDGKSLWVTTPGALFRLREKGGPKTRSYWLPGGSRSLQAVAARAGQVWIATEDRGPTSEEAQRIRNALIWRADCPRVGFWM